MRGNVILSEAKDLGHGAIASYHRAEVLPLRLRMTT